ncbi:LVIVD repeat-containing protein [Streptomyces sp. URMC 129]|uniref:LVIVD repeat-containing protein n=1 Tax=Streptomyces sp. URMC 129 TaxID=3423407 RepID=UPI003F1B8C0A
MTSLHSPPQRRRRRGAFAFAAALLAAACLAGPAAAAPDPGDGAPGTGDVAESERAETLAAIESGAIPGVDETAHSDNVTPLANVPHSAALAGLNTDLAFQGDYAFAGNYDGFVVYDISRPAAPEIVTQVLCPGGQGDVTVNGDLLIMSVDSSRSDDSCRSTSRPASEKDAWEGIRVFDISDVRNPEYVAAVETSCGSHTHTVVPERRTLWVYVSSYGPASDFPDCRPPHDGISVVEVPVAAPERAELSSFDVVFPDGGFGGDADSSATTGCHDITAYPALDLAAGACLGDGVLFDISDPARPAVIDVVRDTDNFAFWHSATFSQDGDKIVFTDELGGGVAATCDEETGDEFGANGIYHVTGRGDDRQLTFQSYFKIPRHQADTENCVAHNGSLIPAAGRDIMVQAWYQGGVSIWDFTDSDNPREIGYFERGPVSADTLTFGGSWSAYYYNGHIYSSDQAGLDVLRIDDPRTNSARSVRLDELNVQTQPVYR